MKQVFLFLTLSQIALLGSAQTAFIENKGQVVDQNGIPNSEVLFVLPLRGMNLLLRADGFGYDVYEVQTETPTTATLADQLRMGLVVIPPQPERIAVHRVDISFEAMSKKVQIEKQLLPGSATYNYYTIGTPSEGIHGVRQFGKIFYRNVYNGIDVEFTASKEKGFEYNFIVQAGADVGQISMEYKGPVAMRLNENKLHLSLSTNDLMEKIPASFLLGSHEPVDVKYTLKSNTLRFITSDNQLNETLVIDPTPNLVYATFFGGPNEDMIEDSGIDGEGNIYMVGHTTSMSDIATTGAFQTVIGGTYDVLIAKFDAQHQLVWATYMGGDNWDYSTSVTLTEDAVFVTGFTQSSEGMASTGAFQETLVGSQNAFASRFDAFGSRVWSSYFGTSVEGFSKVIVINDNTLIAVGFTQSPSLPFSFNPFQATLNGDKDALISQWDLEGNPLYCSYFGGEFTENFNDVIQDENGLIWMSGSTRSSSGIATNSAFQQEYGGGISDLMLVAFTPDFQFEYATYFGSTGDDYNSSLDFANGKIYLNGQTTYGDLLTSINAFQETNFGGRDALYVVINESLEVEYCTLFGGEFGDDNFKTVIYENEIYFIGGTRSTENIALSGAHQQDFMDSGLDNIWKVFIGKMNSNNELLWCTYFGNYSYTRAANLHIYDGKLIVTGWSRSTADLPEEMQIPISTPDAYQVTNSGEEDAFIAEFDSFTGIEIERDANDFKIYPNPTRSMVYLILPSFDNWTMELYNAQGQLVKQETRTQSKFANLDLNKTPVGCYILKCSNGSGSLLVERLIIE